jgi:hypothetical protein
VLYNPTYVRGGEDKAPLIAYYMALECDIPGDQNELVSKAVKFLTPLM